MRKLLALIACAWLAVGIPAALAGSAYTPADDTATTGYTPGAGANWTDPDPSTAAAALDALAARVPVAGGIGGTTGVADNRVLRSDGVGGLTAQASPLECSDTGDVSGVAGLTLSGNITMSGAGATVDGVDVGALATSVSAEVAVSQSGTGACAASRWASTLNSDAAPTCTQPAFSDLSGAATDAQVPDTITVSLAATATALASDPADCGANQYATAIDAGGNLTCAGAGGGTTASIDHTAFYNLAAGVGMIYADCAAAACYIRLPSPATMVNKEFTVRIVNGGIPYGVNIDAWTLGGTTIEGATSVNFYGTGVARTVWCDGSIYRFKGSYSTISGSTSGTDERLVRTDGSYDGGVQSSAVSLTDGGDLSGIGHISLSGLVDGVDVSGIPAYAQTSDGELSSIAGLTSAADAVPYYTGSGTASVFTATQGGRAMAGLSWSAGTQVPSLTAAGTAGLLTVGTGANNLVQLNGSGAYPAASGAAITGVAATTAAALSANPADCSAGQYATGIAASGDLTCAAITQGQVSTACSWTKEWTAADGDIVTVGGFTLTNLTNGGISADSAGVSYQSLSSSAAVGNVTYGSSLPADADGWEVELDFVPATLDGSSGIEVDPGTGDAERIYWSGGNGAYVTSAGVNWGNTLKGSEATSRQVYGMLRHRGASSEGYHNRRFLGSAPKTAGAAADGQRWCFLNCGGTGATRIYKVYAIRIKSGAPCTYPPDRRASGEIYP